MAKAAKHRYADCASAAFGGLTGTTTASGIGFVIFGIGLLHGGVMDSLTYVGGVGYQILFPIWAFLLGRLLGKRDGA